MSIRQYVIPDPANIVYKQYHDDINETPSIVWQQQMEKTYIKTYKLVHNDRPDRYYEEDYTADFQTRFRPLQLNEGYPHYIDPEYGIDPYWDNSLYDQRKLHFKCEEYPPTDDEDDPEIPNNKLSRALIELWQTNSKITDMEEIEDTNSKDGSQTEPGLLDETAFLHVLVTNEGEPAYIPLSTNLGLKYKRRMLYFPMDFGELTIDGLIDTGALSSAIPEAGLRKIRLLAPQSKVKEGPAPTFQFMVANGQLAQSNPKKHR